MDYWKHSLLSKKKFGGEPEDYVAVHKFLDSSKLFYFHNKHRLLLHNTYGIGLCVRKFGETIVNKEGKTILIRDVAAEHCKEDLCGVVPTLNHWFKTTDPEVLAHIKPLRFDDAVLDDFVLQPYLMSGLKAALLITQSNFGVSLAKEFLGLERSLVLAGALQGAAVHELLQYVKLTERWQYAPGPKQLKEVHDEFSA